MPPLWGFCVLVVPFSINMPPLWGFKTFGCPVFYKHAAPLGLLCIGCSVFYKHAAPLGLNAAMHLSPLLTFPLSCFLTHHALRDVVPTGAGDGDCPCVAGDEDKGTSPGDGDVSGIARSADQFELPVICEDDHRDVAANPRKRE